MIKRFSLFISLYSWLLKAGGKKEACYSSIDLNMGFTLTEDYAKQNSCIY